MEMLAKDSDPESYSYLPLAALRPEVYGVSLETLLPAAAAGTMEPWCWADHSLHCLSPR